MALNASLGYPVQCCDDGAGHRFMGQAEDVKEYKPDGIQALAPFLYLDGVVRFVTQRCLVAPGVAGRSSPVLLRRHLLLPTVTPGSRAAGREPFPNMRGGLWRSSAAGAN